jgi:hypothetical protein
LAALNVTAVVDAQTADASGEALAALSAAGVDVASGGWGKGNRLRWSRARSDVDRASNVIKDRSGAEASLCVLARRIDGFDLVMSRRARERLLQPDHVVRDGSVPSEVQGRTVYLIDGQGMTPQQLVDVLDTFGARATAAGLSTEPLGALR